MVERLKNVKKKVGKQFSSLVANAFEYLDKALDRIDTDPKTTILHFYTAVELFVKARLMKEHWALIVTRPVDASLSDFESGNFQSVTLKDARKRIANLMGKDMSDDAYNCFIEIGNHRNRLVHFHNTSTNLRESATKDVLRGLCYLENMLLHKWKFYFQSYEKRFKKILDRASKLREFLAARLAVLEPEINREIKKGAIYEECESCGFVASKLTPVYQKIFDSSCRVCGFSAKTVKVNCLSCATEIFVANGEGTCPACKGSIDIEQVVDQLLSVPPSGMRAKHALEEYELALKAVGPCEGCMWLVGVVTLFPLGEKPRRWLCISCNEEVDQVNECQNCGVLFNESDGFGFYCGVCRGGFSSASGPGRRLKQWSAWATPSTLRPRDRAMFVLLLMRCRHGDQKNHGGELA